MATLGSPKKLKNPMTVNTGYWETGMDALANHPANKTKLMVRIFPILGKLNDAGMITSTVVSAWLPWWIFESISFLLVSVSRGSTTKIFPVANAVTSAVLTGPTISLYLNGVMAATNAGKIQKLSNNEMII